MNRSKRCWSLPVWWSVFWGSRSLSVGGSRKLLVGFTLGSHPLVLGCIALVERVGTMNAAPCTRCGNLADLDDDGFECVGEGVFCGDCSSEHMRECRGCALENAENYR